MQSADGLSTKRQVLVDALTMCLERSKVSEIIDTPTLRSVLDTAAGAGELWRQGEIHLEYLWKILCQQPGLTVNDVAPPLLVLKAFEDELGVSVLIPAELAAMPTAEQARLRDGLGLRRSDFAEIVTQLRALAADDQQRAADDTAAKAQTDKAQTDKAQADKATGAPAAGRRASYEAPPAKSNKSRSMLAVALCVLALAAVTAALYLTFADTASIQSVADLDGMLRLEDARRAGPSMIARIADPKWEGLSREEQQKLAEQLFEAVGRKGVHALSLTDGQGRERVQAIDLGGQRAVMLR